MAQANTMSGRVCGVFGGDRRLQHEHRSRSDHSPVCGTAAQRRRRADSAACDSVSASAVEPDVPSRGRRSRSRDRSRSGLDAESDTGRPHPSNGKVLFGRGHRPRPLMRGGRTSTTRSVAAVLHAGRSSPPSSSSACRNRPRSSARHVTRASRTAGRPLGAPTCRWAAAAQVPAGGEESLGCAAKRHVEPQRRSHHAGVRAARSFNLGFNGQLAAGHLLQLRPSRPIAFRVLRQRHAHGRRDRWCG